MIFVDANVFMYAVGRPHPLQEEAQRFFAQSLQTDAPLLCTSAEVLQELLHVYQPVQRTSTLDAALTLANDLLHEVWAVEAEDVKFARLLSEQLPALQARDLLHLACCRRRNVGRIKTFDRALASAFR